MKVQEGKKLEDGGLLNEETGRNVSYTKHIMISRRDTFVNDLKNSTWQGIVAFILSILAIPCLVWDIYVSYAHGGNADYAVGVYAVGILVLCVISLVFARFGLKNRNKIRHDLERRAIVLNIIVILLLAALYAYGLIRILRG